MQRSDVFISLTPKNKKHIVATYRTGGNTVGISVDAGADIAKETANMILLEKDLNIIKDSLIEERKVYVNIIKYIKMTPRRISDT